MFYNILFGYHIHTEMQSFYVNGFDETCEKWRHHKAHKVTDERLNSHKLHANLSSNSLVYCLTLSTWANDNHATIWECPALLGAFVVSYLEQC